MALDPQVQAMRARQLAKDVPPLYTLSLEQARAADLEAIRATGGSPEPVAGVIDDHFPGPAGPVPVRVYLPEGSGPFPVLVYFFGGGWTLGSVDTSDGICRRLTNAVGCVTVTVGYRLAPEHRFPAAVDDCFAATQWIAEHGGTYGADVTRLAVGGDSAGGNLAAVVSLLARDRGGPSLSCQVLVYPNTDHSSDTSSMRDNTDPAFFNAKSVAWYWDHYLSSAEDGENPLVSPLRADEHSGLPPALVITAEHDPLRDQGEEYAHKLTQSGVPVELTRYDGMIHGFFSMMGELDAGRHAIDQAAQYLRKFLT